MSYKHGQRRRDNAKQISTQHIHDTAPERYHDSLVPKFMVGSKRRVFDTAYLESLHRDNVEFYPEGVKAIRETSVVRPNGKRSQPTCAPNLCPPPSPLSLCKEPC